MGNALKCNGLHVSTNERDSGPPVIVELPEVERRGDGAFPPLCQGRDVGFGVRSTVS